MTDLTRRSEEESPNRMPVSEFRRLGYLQEVNRRLLHPLGLAIEVGRATEPTRRILLTEPAVEALRELIGRIRILDPDRAGAMDDLEALVDAGEVLQPGDEILSGIWDCRDDPEGIIFGDGLIDAEKARLVTDEINLRSLARVASLGYLIQDVGEEPAKPDGPPDNPSNRSG